MSKLEFVPAKKGYGAEGFRFQVDGACVYTVPHHEFFSETPDALFVIAHVQEALAKGSAVEVQYPQTLKLTQVQIAYELIAGHR